MEHRTSRCGFAVVSIQAFLTELAVRTNAHTAERERHARERVELLQRIITAADDERFKTASDFHDGPVAHISGLALMLSAAARDPSDKSAAMEEVADELRKVQGELRTQIFALSPHDLDKPGRLREEVTTKQLRALRERGVDVDVAIPDVVPLDRPALELVHHVCREALANVAQHARATHVSVALVVEGADVILTVDDDGQGFSARTSSDSAHKDTSARAFSPESRGRARNLRRAVRTGQRRTRASQSAGGCLASYLNDQDHAEARSWVLLAALLRNPTCLLRPPMWADATGTM